MHDELQKAQTVKTRKNRNLIGISYNLQPLNILSNGYILSSINYVISILGFYG